MNRVNSRQLITILATLLTITLNGLANALPLNGQSTGEISDRFAIYFVPAGYVFSIWGLIYLGLVAYTIYQALPAQKDNKLLKKIAPVYWIGSLANIAWIFLWHYEFFPLTLLAMIILLATLIFIYRQMSEVKSGLEGSLNWFVRLPFSIYLGWISVATIANVSQVLSSSGWGGWGISDATWAVIMTALATVLGLLMVWREGEIPYALVLVWAFVGIAQKQAASALVATAAWVTSGLLVVAVLIIPFLKRRLRVGG
jgi:hypothetical protein